MIVKWSIAVALVAFGALAVSLWIWTRPVDVPLEREWTATVSTLAGDGSLGVRDGDARLARFSDPFGIAVSADGTVYVADAGEAQAIRAISPAGVVTTVARGFSSPSGLAIDATGTVYVADTGSNSIKRVAHDGQVTTVAAGFNGPLGVAVDAAGRVFVADTYNDRIRMIADDGTLHTVASDVAFNTPGGIAVDAAGNIYVADTGNNAIHVITPTGVTSTIDAGGQFFVRPTGIAVATTGELFVADERGRIFEVPPGGAARLVAGSASGFADGTGLEARFRRPAAVAVAGFRRLVVADTGNVLVRVVEATAQREAGAPSSPFLNPKFDVDTFALQPLLWPVAPMDGPHEVAGTHGEARGGEGADRFHAGIDVRAEAGTPVRAIRDGVVVTPLAAGDFGSLSEWMRIGPVAYVHIRVGRDARGRLVDLARFVPTYDAAGKLARVRVKRGARFRAGEVIGSVNPFNHVHLNVGWPGEEINPLRLRLTQFDDTIRPTIARNGIRLLDEAGEPLPRRKDGRHIVSGPVQVVVDAWDQADGNRPQRRLGLYELGYQVLHPDGSPLPGYEMPRITMRFDRLAPNEDAARLVYAPGSGIPFYGRRVTRFLYVVTNTYQRGVASRGAWDTTTLADGEYTLRVRAADVRGNEAIANRDVRVVVERSAPVAGGAEPSRIR
jgi:sugar lactone lactonase YvrE